jgi:hypothetical protein
LELFEEVKLGAPAARGVLLKEVGELLAIFISIGQTTEANSVKKK